MKALTAVIGLTTLLFLPRPGPAPPGAPEGFGADTPGGRGGREIAVTTLADAGPGSFRAAMTAAGPRIVVFSVAGLITLDTPVVIAEPYLTLDGQTAPGDGVCIRGSEVVIRTHDVIVRHMRFRPGDIGGKEVDALNVAGDSHHVLVDHVSASWAVDETLSASGAIHDVTIQWSIIAEGLNHSVHAKGAHGYGSLVRAAGGVTLHHNLWAHNDSRNPRLGDNYGNAPFPTFDVRNNVIYDYGAIASGMTGDHLSANYVANYIRPGPSSNRTRGPIVLTDTAAVRYFVRDNVVEGRDDLTKDNRRLFDRRQFEGRELFTVAPEAFPAPPVRTTSASEALGDVLAGAGATLRRRDAVDLRLVHEVEQRSGRVIDSQKDVGGWPEYRAAGKLPAR
jgi:pectate lyase